MADKDKVIGMFNSIAPTYDFLNHFLSLNIDKVWRRKLVKLIAPYKPERILDVASGTGDLAIALTRLKPDGIVGVDISEGMLEVGRKKIARKGLSDIITLLYGDSESLPFPTNSFNAVAVSFGVRNFANLDAGLADMCRVLKPGGVVAVLEFSMPRRFPIVQFYKFYFLKVLPFFGKMFSGHHEAYTYLPESVLQFPNGERFLHLMREAGFSNVREKRLSFGIASIYTGEKIIKAKRQ
ncbi:bifunctional demethylmenaquinone methyltransferase/2-methoxy-6-polyprenyl-1,4-benzoquinol methylase UbiE [Williamwhitmania taraxaci]|uniref:Demethylmenaquinone methyltransferase n=1 Tax=Williamwhitmania taraxaci TaxID=1640674 RepID=A0A1G6GIX5_9BACT|nr:bifunctional demethylmenaquinone methyltransferase/2-methoxy-6-polyprenyl-1,4-benzoquinol methylase UbiE [Williamwhitmania taraxaci]SDB81773.1 demethylmenaquinone methyltransferase [Williamwhitmania taraxaci]